MRWRSVGLMSLVGGSVVLLSYGAFRYFDTGGPPVAPPDAARNPPASGPVSASVPVPPPAAPAAGPAPAAARPPGTRKEFDAMMRERRRKEAAAAGRLDEFLKEEARRARETEALKGSREARKKAWDKQREERTKRKKADRAKHPARKDPRSMPDLATPAPQPGE